MRLLIPYGLIVFCMFYLCMYKIGTGEWFKDFREDDRWGWAILCSIFWPVVPFRHLVIKIALFPYFLGVSKKQKRIDRMKREKLSERRRKRQERELNKYLEKKLDTKIKI